MRWNPNNRARHIIFVLPSLLGGGSERVASLLANWMTEKGIRVSIALTWGDGIAYPLKETVEVINNTGEKGAIGQIRFLSSVMGRNKEAVFLGLCTYQNVYLLIAGFFRHNRVIVSERNDPKRTTKGRKTMGLARKLLYPYADGIIFQTRDARAYFSRRVQRKSRIIYNPLMPDIPGVYRGKREKRIVGVGRIDVQKNLPMMLRGVCRVLKKYPGYHFELYGEGYGEGAAALRKELKGIAQKAKVAERVHFMGFREDVAQCIQRAGVYVNTSDYEGISNAMLEAMAMGIPCVCTDCPAGGARMFVRDGENGSLVPVGNVEAFVEALERTIEQMERFSDGSAKSAEALRKELDIGHIAEQWLDICFPLG